MKKDEKKGVTVMARLCGWLLRHLGQKRKTSFSIDYLIINEKDTETKQVFDKSINKQICGYIF